MREFTYPLVLQTQTRISETLSDEVQQHVKAVLREDIFAIVLGVILTVIGLTAISIHLFRGRSQGRLLLWFGLFTGLYGLRLLASTETMSLLVDVTPVFWRYQRSGITSVILVAWDTSPLDALSSTSNSYSSSIRRWKMQCEYRLRSCLRRCRALKVCRS